MSPLRRCAQGQKRQVARCIEAVTARKQGQGLLFACQGGFRSCSNTFGCCGSGTATAQSSRCSFGCCSLPTASHADLLCPRSLIAPKHQVMRDGEMLMGLVDFATRDDMDRGESRWLQDVGSTGWLGLGTGKHGLMRLEDSGVSRGDSHGVACPRLHPMPHTAESSISNRQLAVSCSAHPPPRSCVWSTSQCMGASHLLPLFRPLSLLHAAIRRLDDSEFKNPFDSTVIRVVEDTGAGGEQQ